MTAGLPKGVLLGLLTAIVGVGACLAPFGSRLEESVGLDILFGLRGERRPPADVVIISMDKASAENLNLPENPRKWPRQLHAGLIDNLKREGAEVIVFDIFFEEPHSAGEDGVLSKAIGRARNVILAGYLRSEKVSVENKETHAANELAVVRLAHPLETFAQSALGIAPFPLPKVPVRVNQYWTFQTGAGDIPTLPVVTLQAFTLGVYDEFRHFLGNVSPSRSAALPSDGSAVVAGRGLQKMVRAIEDIFEGAPPAAELLRKEVENRGLSLGPEKKQRIMALVKMYSGEHNRYLNFYGPPRTITTIPYYQMLKSRQERTGDAQRAEIRGKAVFVGLSELYPEQKDGFYTVFTQANGIDLSGVEVAATAFANLLEDMHVQPLGVRLQLAIIASWGMLTGILFRRFRAGVGLAVMMGIGLAYLIGTEHQFKTSGAWYPLVIPMFMQTPFAFVAALSLKYRDAQRERERIRKAFGYYLPDGVVDRLSKSIADIKTDSELVYGICLSTDAEQYTSLSETMDPKELSAFMNRYYETLFGPIGRHAGAVANVVGDSMLAIWVTADPGSALRHESCLAALDVAESVRRFNQGSGAPPLPTRIGLHSGFIALGSIGAVDHYEYRPVGDIVNTTTRIEGLNKYLGTRILVSDEVIQHLTDFLTRAVGEFLLLGKSRPVVVHELLCRREEVNGEKMGVCAAFAGGMECFRRQAWDEAIEKFSSCITARGEDGPSRFYINLCEHYRIHPPGDSWNGVVSLDRK